MAERPFRMDRRDSLVCRAERHAPGESRWRYALSATARNARRGGRATKQILRLRPLARPPLRMTTLPAAPPIAPPAPQPGMQSPSR
jgi:hypothetical protein